MIVSRRMKVPRGNAPADKLLEHMHEYLRNNAGGKVLRYAIVDVKGNDFIVDVSVRADAGSDSQAAAENRRQAAHGTGTSSMVMRARHGKKRVRKPKKMR